MVVLQFTRVGASGEDERQWWGLVAGVCVGGEEAPFLSLPLPPSLPPSLSHSLLLHTNDRFFSYLTKYFTSPQQRLAMVVVC